MLGRLRSSHSPSASAAPAAKTRSLLGLLLCGSVALGGLLVGARPASADPSRPAPQKQIATSNDPLTAASLYEIEAVQNEKQGRWLGAVAAWRGFARTSLEDGAWRKAMDRLHDLSGLSWSTAIKAREMRPLVVGKDVVAVPYRVKYSDGMRDVVSAVDPTSGRVLWTREDAVVFPCDGDVAVFVQNWEHVVRVDLKTGGDAWSYAFPAPNGARVAGARNQAGDDLRGEGPRRVLGLKGDTVVLQGDTWPLALDLATGKVRWGAHAEARRGYRARLTPAGVVAWPGEARPAAMSETEWQSSPMVLLAYDDGHVIWKRATVAGEPWAVVPSGQRLYMSDPNLQTEVAWTAVSLDKGTTVWRQPQAEARPSKLTVTDKVLVMASPEGLENHLTRFLDPTSGKVLWQSEHVLRLTPQGFALERVPGEPLQARELATGRALWSLALPEGLDVDADDAVVESNLYMSAHAPGPLSGSDTPGAVRASTATGQIEWTHRAADTPYQQDMRMLAMAGDTVLLEQTMQISHPKLAARTPVPVSSLLALDAAKGEVQWGFYDIHAVPASPPVRAGEMLYVVGQDRDGFSVYAFDLARIRELVKQGRRWWW